MDKEVLLTFLLIFSLRIVDTTLSTLTTMFMSQGNKKLAPLMGFAQTATWVTCLNIVMNKLSNPMNLLIYAIAYGCGVCVGIMLEEKIASGNVIIQGVIDEKDKHIITELRNMNIMVTSMEGQGRENSKRLVLFIALQRKKLNAVRKYLRDNHVFITVSKGDMYLNINPNSK
ncbi:DUF2179 domain-containing protein [Peptoanaerobacter stomatis]|uniref:DUF5698 domain-containing protein n=1 Tax=Peptoanaerobacter stomatis TaxID=796937 RepID=G9X9S0_9FIRM|nr:DUF5698 domain-containing protein [Peptoanaerobacter stomatis]EHL13235.1 hypothetical protein HMPREF9629_00535 [Peptoanaerobacter stomatis]EHL20166.1 hypothetical protein HMPREF9628_00011 [Peptoanaerobacter stomatis]